MLGCVDSVAVYYHVNRSSIRLVWNLLQALFQRGCGGGSGMDPGVYCSRGADRGQHVQPEPRPRGLDAGRPAPAAPRSAPGVVRGPAGLVGPEQQRSLLLRTLGEGGAGGCDPSPRRGGVRLAGPALGALRGTAAASQDPAHRRQGQLDWELAAGPWPGNSQRSAGKLKLERVGRFIPQSGAGHLSLVAGAAGRASWWGLLSESLASAAGLEPKPGADCANAHAEVLG